MADPEENPNYAIDLPSEETIRMMLATQLELYSARDARIRQFRQHLDGENGIKVPESVQFKAVPQHGYGLRAVMEEKASRYRRVPEIKISPDTNLKRDQKAADELGKASNRVLDLIESASGESTWSQMMFDGNGLDGCVERIECAPAAFWPSLVVVDGHDKFTRIFQDPDEYKKRKEAYKRQAGIPIRTVWVPLERFYPVVEGNTMIECFELEERSMRSVLGNKQFDTTRLATMSNGRKDGGLKQKVIILHYANQKYHAYYALGPSYAAMSGSSLDLGNLSSASAGGAQAILLYKYEHGIGEPNYNFVRGRGSGWLNGANPRVGGTMKALLDLNQDIDELMSQMATFIRNALWQTRVMKFSAENRGTDGGLPTPANIPEGGLIPMWSDESIADIISPLMQQFELAEFFYNAKKAQLAELAGSGVLSGQRQPGVNAGYHEQLQIDMAEHLDALSEENFAWGAANRMRMIYKLIRALNEAIPVHLALIDAKGKPGGKWLSIDPAQLEPLPNISAKVRDPRPIDMTTAIQAALQATTMRPGQNTPLMSDKWARVELLGVTDSESLDLEIREQKLTTKLWDSDPLYQALAKAFGMALAQTQAPAALTPEEAAGASPAMQQAAQAAIDSGATAQQGGVSAPTQDAMMAGMAASGTQALPPPPVSGPQAPPSPAPQQAPTGGAGGVLAGVGGGPSPGAPQVQQALGRARELVGRVT